MSAAAPEWLHLRRGEAPLVLSIPHGGTQIPADIEQGLLSPWRARMDTDWWLERLYEFAGALDATIVRTTVSRTVIDLNRDPDGAALYPGMATTALCPTTSFDGEPLYRAGHAPGEHEIRARRAAFFAPYHAAIAREIARLRARHARVVLYDAHSIRSRVPMLFEGELPVFNIGSNQGRSCGAALREAVAAVCAASGQPTVTDARFKGGYITRHYGAPAQGVHAIQMELACRAYLDEPAAAPTEHNWPAPFDDTRAQTARATLRRVLDACLRFAHSS